jgi:hypothetical protein
MIHFFNVRNVLSVDFAKAKTTQPTFSMTHISPTFDWHQPSAAGQVSSPEASFCGSNFLKNSWFSTISVLLSTKCRTFAAFIFKLDYSK